MNKNYEPYGKEWRKEMKKINKEGLITILADSLKKYEELKRRFDREKCIC